MASIASQLDRVAKLEQRTRAPRSSFELHYGSIDNFEAVYRAKLDAGKLDSVEFPLIIKAIRRWHSDGSYSAWYHNKIWNYHG